MEARSKITAGDGANAAALRQELTGVLIGLARATEGSEYRLTDDTILTAVEALAATRAEGAAEEETLRRLIRRVDEEKRKLVPECYSCACPCGRTENFDLRRLEKAEEGIRSLKLRILADIREISAVVPQALVCAEAFSSFLYRALYAIGMEDWEEEDLIPILEEAGERKRKYMKS